MVEVGVNAAHWVDPPLARRLVQLEVDDVEVPPPPEAKTESRSPGVYVRIVFHDGRLIVELWDRGELQGRRLLSPSGGKPLTARRIALASGELASRLRERRLFEARRHRREQARLAAERRRPKLPKIAALPAMTASIDVAHASDGGLWLWGPHLRGALRLDRGVELALGAGVLSGEATGLSNPVDVQAFELSLSPGYWLRTSHDWALRFGMNATGGVMHVLDASIWSRGDWETETWTARATGEARAAWSLSRAVHLELALEAGAMLKTIWIRTSDDERYGLGGAWFGASGGITLL